LHDRWTKLELSDFELWVLEVVFWGFGVVLRLFGSVVTVSPVLFGLKLSRRLVNWRSLWSQGFLPNIIGEQTSQCKDDEPGTFELVNKSHIH